jgi:hypothetical protein
LENLSHGLGDEGRRRREMKCAGVKENGVEEEEGAQKGGKGYRRRSYARKERVAFKMVISHGKEYPCVSSLKGGQSLVNHAHWWPVK